MISPIRSTGRGRHGRLPFAIIAAGLILCLAMQNTAAARQLINSNQVKKTNGRVKTGKPQPSKQDDSLTKENSEPKNELGISFGDEVKYKWKVGIQIKTAGARFTNVVFTIPVPVDWPEQTVVLLNENVPIEIGAVKYRDLKSGVRQIYTKIRSIPAGKLVEFDMTFLVTVREILPPPDTTIFVAPKPVPREVKDYLGVGPDISYRKGKIRSTVKQIVADIESPWDQTEALFDWVRDNVEFRDGKQQDSLTTFRQKQGCGEDLVGLFVAMCRANKIPARMVWVEGHQYAEFYLWDAEKNGHWFPCNVSGLREFGSYSAPRIIQQKGDNIKVPESKKRQKFVAEFVTGQGTAKPKLRFIRELNPVD